MRLPVIGADRWCSVLLRPCLPSQQLAIWPHWDSRIGLVCPIVVTHRSISVSGFCNVCMSLLTGTLVYLQFLSPWFPMRWRVGSWAECRFSMDICSCCFGVFSCVLQCKFCSWLEFSVYSNTNANKCYFNKTQMQMQLFTCTSIKTWWICRYLILYSWKKKSPITKCVPSLLSVSWTLPVYLQIYLNFSSRILVMPRGREESIFQSTTPQPFNPAGNNSPPSQPLLLHHEVFLEGTEPIRVQWV